MVLWWLLGVESGMRVKVEKGIMFDYKIVLRANRQEKKVSFSRKVSLWVLCVKENKKGRTVMDSGASEQN